MNHTSSSGLAALILKVGSKPCYKNSNIHRKSLLDGDSNVLGAICLVYLRVSINDITILKLYINLLSYKDTGFQLSIPRYY